MYLSHGEEVSKCGLVDEICEETKAPMHGPIFTASRVCPLPYKKPGGGGSIDFSMSSSWFLQDLKESCCPMCQVHPEHKLEGHHHH